MAINLAQTMRFAVDLASGLITLPQRAHLNYGDVDANQIVVTVTENKAPADLTGLSATGAFYRPGDAAQIQLTGTISGNEIRVTLTDHCYAVEGNYEAEVKLTQGSVMRTILSITGYVHRAGSGMVADVSGVVPSLDALLAQIQATKDAAAAANTAANTANTAAANAGNQAKAAQEAAQEATDAAAGAKPWANASMTAVGLPAGSAPTVELTKNAAGNYVIALGIPKGDTGATPQIAVEVLTGEAGSDAAVSVSGTAENPVIRLTIPRGDTGSIDNLTINGKTAENGAITLTAADVGALLEGGTAADSAKLENKTLAEIMLLLYPVGAIYISTVETSPASLFGGAWEQLKDRFLLGAGDSYPIGSWGGEASVIIEQRNMAYNGAVITYDGATAGIAITSNLPANQWGFAAVGNIINASYGNALNNMPPYLAVYMWQRVS